MSELGTAVGKTGGVVVATAEEAYQDQATSSELDGRVGADGVGCKDEGVGL
jgi:hypothetical protein